MIVNEKDALVRLDNDTDIYADLLDAFLEAGESDMKNLETAQRAGDRKQVLYIAHKLKGASLTIGAEDLSRNAGTIEAALRADITADVSASVEAAAPLYKNTAIELRKIRDDLRTRS
jgi:HPt (histidine-containing phosphotransfer) domain-containing protein